MAVLLLVPCQRQYTKFETKVMGKNLKKRKPGLAYKVIIQSGLLLLSNNKQIKLLKKRECNDHCYQGFF